MHCKNITYGDGGLHYQRNKKRSNATFIFKSSLSFLGWTPPQKVPNKKHTLPPKHALPGVALGEINQYSFLQSSKHRVVKFPVKKVGKVFETLFVAALLFIIFTRPISQWLTMVNWTPRGQRPDRPIAPGRPFALTALSSFGDSPRVHPYIDDASEIQFNLTCFNPEIRSREKDVFGVGK